MADDSYRIERWKTQVTSGQVYCYDTNPNNGKSVISLKVARRL
jgi:hypothetical protein